MPQREGGAIFWLPVRAFRGIHGFDKAVCYLNNHGKDFEGGFFLFQDGDPAKVVPVAGDALICTTDSRNIHAVDEVVQFYYWKAFELQQTRGSREISNSRICHCLPDERRHSKFCGDKLLVDAFFGNIRSPQLSMPFGWNDFSSAIDMWEGQVCTLQRGLTLYIPYWTTKQANYSVDSTGG